MSAIVESVAGEYDRLEWLLEVFSSVKGGNRERALALLRELEEGLQGRMAREERALLPVFAGQNCRRGQACRKESAATLRADHQRIREGLQALRDRISRGGPVPDELVGGLAEALEAHHRREMASLYPTMEPYLCGEVDRAG